MFLFDKKNTQGTITLQKIDGKTGEPVNIFGWNILGKFLHKYHIDLYIPFITGNYGKSITFHNVITNAGLYGLAARMIWDSGEGDTIPQFNYLAVGIGTTAATAADTTLETEITDSGLARAVATLDTATTTETDDTSTLTYTWTSNTNTKAVTECGILNAAAAGILLGRQVFPAINLVGTNGDQLTLVYSVQHS